MTAAELRRRRTVVDFERVVLDIRAIARFEEHRLEEYNRLVRRGTPIAED